MRLEGSCHCGAVRFELESRTVHPYRYCYCKRCIKTNGGIGGAVHISGDPETFKVEGAEHLFIYSAKSNPQAPGEPPTELKMHNCRHCGSHLYLIAPIWPEWVYPAASAIDTPLPVPPEYFHINLAQKPEWVHVPSGDGHVHFDAVPEESIEAWHKRNDVFEE